MYYIDPVCKKKLRRKEEYAILKFNRAVYHFCCKACKEIFLFSPYEYVPKPQVLKVESAEVN